MIDKMKKIVVVAPSERKGELLLGIRDLGLVHISERSAPDSGLSERLASLSRVRGVLAEQPKRRQGEIVEGIVFEALHESLSKAIDEKRALSDEINRMKMAADGIRRWGDFDPDEVRDLDKAGIPLSFYILGRKELSALDKDVKYIILKGIDKQNAIAVVGQPLGPEYGGSRFMLPEKGLSQLERGIEQRKARLNDIEMMLKAGAENISSYDREIGRATDDIVLRSVNDAAGEDEGLSILTGFIPADDLDTFRKAAKANAWAYGVDDPSDEDPVPTKISYNKVTKMMKPLFDMLGTVPGYREYDISTYFLLFLSLFFAMIIGDAAYGVIFLSLGIAMNIKSRSLSNLNMFIYVMSVATIAWGAVTGTWFGSEKAMEIGFLKALVIPSIANYPQYFGVDPTSAQNAVMKFCFAVGSMQLSLACVMNVIRNWRRRSLAFVADFAWLMMIIAIYNLVLMLVVGQDVDGKMVFGMIGGGFLLVVLFGGQEAGKSFRAGLKAGLGGAFNTFLNTIGAFGNVMSYIRLFAVGMASLAIAQSFNGMASPILRGLAFPAGMLILIIGHGLNIVMGMLSVVVHGVRLNLLEFSGQLGMEWAGIPYEPLKKNV